jgi:hypothetical protein
MTHHLLTNRLAPRQPRKRQGQHRRPAASLRRYRPLLEPLENRIVPVVVTPFNVRFSANITGAVTSITNPPETASTVNRPGRTQQDVIDDQNGVGPNTNNKVARSEFKKQWFCTSPRYC